MGRKSPMGVVFGEWEITVGTIALSPNVNFNHPSRFNIFKLKCRW